MPCPLGYLHEAHQAGLEPATPRLGNEYSVRLSYWRGTDHRPGLRRRVGEAGVEPAKSPEFGTGAFTNLTTPPCVRARDKRNRVRFSLWGLSIVLFLVPKEGVEPSRPKAHGSEPCVSASSTISA